MIEIQNLLLENLALQQSYTSAMRVLCFQHVSFETYRGMKEMYEVPFLCINEGQSVSLARGPTI